MKPNLNRLVADAPDLRQAALVEAVSDDATIAGYIDSIHELARSKGVRLEVRTDFEELLEVNQSIAERTPLTPIFDPACSRVGPSNGLWIKGTDRAGEVVHLQAARRADLAGGNLAQHFETYRHLYCSRGFGIDPDSSVFDAAPALRRITGSVVYHGEIWLRGGPNGFRGCGLGTVLPRLVLALSLARWAPDFMVGFVRPAVAFKGIPIRYGYMHVQPGGILWNVPGEERPVDEWLAWLDREEVRYLMRYPPGMEC